MRREARHPVASGPGAQGRSRPEQRKPRGSDRPNHDGRRPPTAIVLSVRRLNDPLDANHTQSQVIGVLTFGKNTQDDLRAAMIVLSIGYGLLDDVSPTRAYRELRQWIMPTWSE